MPTSEAPSNDSLAGNKHRVLQTRCHREYSVTAERLTTRDHPHNCRRTGLIPSELTPDLQACMCPSSRSVSHFLTCLIAPHKLFFGAFNEKHGNKKAERHADSGTRFAARTPDN